MHEALSRGHRLAIVDYLWLAMEADGSIWANAYVPPQELAESRERLVDALKAGDLPKERVCLSRFDVVLLRNNPSERLSTWSMKLGNVSALFARHLVGTGPLVINEPEGMERASTVLYLGDLPAAAHPESVVCRGRERVVEAVERLGGPAVIKPLQGFGGKRVFRVDSVRDRNLPSMIDALLEDGFVVVQPWVPGAEEGDKRVLLWRGEPLELPGGRPAVYRRRHQGSDFRHNLHVGGGREPCTLTDGEREILDMVRPRLVEDGLSLVGADLLGGKLLELNVFAPGGVHNISELYQVNAAAALFERMEAAVADERH